MKNNADEIIFRASGASLLMVEPKNKSEKVSEGTKTNLVDIFVSAKYDRKEEINGKMLDKGNEREEDAITLYARTAKKMFKKNTERISNEFITGEPDIFIGESITNADETIDTKCSWSAHTFFRTQHKKLEDSYYWQGQCYMALTGAKKHTVAFCLVNGTPSIIMDEKRKASYHYGIDFENDPKYIEKCKQIEVNHIFDFDSFIKENQWFEFHNTVERLQELTIPMNERIFLKEFERNDDEIIRFYQRIKDCREWMNENLYKLSPKLLINA